MADARENLAMLLTSGGITNSVGVPADTLGAWIETKAWDLDKANFSKYIDQIITHLTNRSLHVNMNLLVYGADEEDGPFTLLQTLALSPADTLNPDVPAKRYFKLRFQDDAVVTRWQLHGFEIFGELVADEF